MLRRLTYANVTATLALVFAMSGGALAARRYAVNSPKQNHPKNAFTKVKKRRGKATPSGPSGEKGATGGTGAPGPVDTQQRGATGATGPAGARGPTGPAGTPGEAGPRGEAGAKGERGEAGLSALALLPPGGSESGELTALDSNPLAGKNIADAVTFPVPMPETLTEAHVIFTTTSGATHCSGEGHAEAGYLCVYVNFSSNVGTPSSRYFESGGTGTPGAGRDGFAAFWIVSASATEAWAEGTWTVTAN